MSVFGIAVFGIAAFGIAVFGIAAFGIAAFGIGGCDPNYRQPFSSDLSVEQVYTVSHCQSNIIQPDLITKWYNCCSFITAHERDNVTDGWTITSLLQ
jgi:hypothetical protein